MSYGAANFLSSRGTAEGEVRWTRGECSLGRRMASVEVGVARRGGEVKEDGRGVVFYVVSAEFIRIHEQGKGEVDDWWREVRSVEEKVEEEVEFIHYRSTSGISDEALARPEEEWQRGIKEDLDGGEDEEDFISKIKRGRLFLTSLDRSCQYQLAAAHRLCHRHC